MAITRRFLTALGIEGDKVDEIITAHLETVNELKEARDRYKEDAEKLPDVQRQLDEAKASSENEGEYEAKYNDLKTEYDQYKQTVETEKLTANKRTAYRSVLQECGVPEKRLDSILRLVDLDAVKLTDDGKIDDVENVKKSIKTDWADFIPADTKKGADTPTPPEGEGKGAGTPSRAAMVAQRHYEAIYGKKEGAK